MPSNYMPYRVPTSSKHFTDKSRRTYVESKPLPTSLVHSRPNKHMERNATDLLKNGVGFLRCRIRLSAIKQHYNNLP